MKFKKIGTLDLILVIIATFILTFTIAMIWLYFQTGGIPDTLCTCVFSFCGGECGIMGWIKTTKDKQQSAAAGTTKAEAKADEAAG